MISLEQAKNTSFTLRNIRELFNVFERILFNVSYSVYVCAYVWMNRRDRNDL